MTRATLCGLAAAVILVMSDGAEPADAEELYGTKEYLLEVAGVTPKEPRSAQLKQGKRATSGTQRPAGAWRR